MLQEPSPQQYELEMVTMKQLVPKEHLVRKLTLLSILNSFDEQNFTTIPILYAIGLLRSL
ncbi:TPA: hypothetical protein ACX3DE_001196 [Vibrio parahaemolyticus]|uniref:hypothetical protein n=1 Tax=Vibrio parahaemolyticus TaxID=670 RepID=UPI0015E00018|nr:hypothetical protein [Vibrio parahaemolyticus]EHV9720171.1 hypothetical protein [Vibrio parahaemolyticus]EID7698073.1 hypothetical protein [Vibrio parahaemolyticus]EJG1426092.1 hypothetical protein [Vibrio parahaemolyticus]MBE4455694.1 hypothetical protein [Vibrio parahaemolyticus]HCE1933389.1 hypothetical protein [Vibrio parahaemolyticus]